MNNKPHTPTCIVCDDLGCEYCPGVEAALTRRGQLAVSALRGSVQSCLDAGFPLDAIRWHFELAVSDWCDEQGEARL